MTCTPTGLTTTGASRRPFPLPSALTALAARLARLASIRSNRSAVRRLARLDDARLRDLGLSRADVDWALSLPWYADPSAALAGRVERRRAAARWARGFETDSRQYADSGRDGVRAAGGR